jgi:hypothetical protein
MDNDIVRHARHVPWVAMVVAVSVTAAVLTPARPSKEGLAREDGGDRSGVMDLPAPRLQDGEDRKEQGDVLRSPDARVTPVNRVEPSPGGSVAGIPATLYSAYQNATLKLAASQPQCRLPATLLAAIGKVESDHARGGRVDASGTTAPPIIGLRLDGSPGLAAIRDTDGGAYDGDVTWDRAVGPMQFIPGTWRRWASDGNSDGRSDPHNVHDAAVAAGRYLCAGGRDLSTPGGLRAGVLSYNHSEHYLNTVQKWMDVYRTGAVAFPDVSGAPDSAGPPAQDPVAPPSEVVVPAPGTTPAPLPTQPPAAQPPVTQPPNPGPTQPPATSPGVPLADLVDGVTGTVCVLDGLIVHVTDQATGLLAGLTSLQLPARRPADLEECPPVR